MQDKLSFVVDGFQGSPSEVGFGKPNGKIKSMATHQNLSHSAAKTVRGPVAFIDSFCGLLAAQSAYVRCSPTQARQNALRPPKGADQARLEVGH